MDITNKHILVCDDCAVSCSLYQTALEIQGYQVDIAYSGASVLEKIESQPPDLLLLDVSMPGMDGYEVAHRIQENQVLQSLPILMITGHEEDEIRGRCQAKVQGIIRKPIDINALLKQVQAALEN